jgi:hypothetical protein
MKPGIESRARAVVALVLASAVVGSPDRVAARPLYFDNLVSIYSIAPSEDIHACGVCHRIWTGTGARNPYGNAVEQQLYLGKPIANAILDVAGDDTDGDGFTNGDELAVHRTLPGYSCANYVLATDPPPSFQSIITPGVPSCLESQDVRVDPTAVNFATEIGKTTTVAIDVVNNGADLPITVSAYGLLAGAPPTLSVTGPATPIVIPVGGRATLHVSYSPVASEIVSTTLRITSDDPDEPDVDVPVGAISFVSPLAPAADRAACLADVARQMERFTKTHLKEWITCYADELRGVACDAGRRELKIGQAEAKLRAAVGGPTDKTCGPRSLTPLRLGLPATCGAPCGAIAVTSLPSLADCLVCRQEAATGAMLGAVTGSMPPDVPAPLASRPHTCSRSLLAAMQKGIRRDQKALDECRVDAVLAPATDCGTLVGPLLASQEDRIDATLARCDDTTGMAGCPFVPPADPGCLGTAATAIATGLSDAVFGPAAP